MDIQQQHQSLHQLYAKTQEYHTKRSNYLLNKLHKKLLNSFTSTPLGQIHLEKAIKFIRKVKIQQQCEGQWAKSQALQENQMEKEMYEQSFNELNQLELEIKELEVDIQNLREREIKVKKDNNKYLQKLLRIEKQEIIEFGSKQIKIPKTSLLQFVFKKGQNGDVRVCQDFYSLILFLQNRLKSNSEVCEYYQGCVENKFMREKKREERKIEHLRNLKQQQRIKKQTQEVNDRLKIYEDLINIKVANFEEKVEQNLKQKVASYVSLNEGRKERYEQAFWELRQLTQKLKDNVNLEKLDNVL